MSGRWLGNTSAPLGPVALEALADYVEVRGMSTPMAGRPGVFPVPSDPPQVDLEHLRAMLPPGCGWEIYEWSHTRPFAFVYAGDPRQGMILNDDAVRTVALGLMTYCLDRADDLDRKGNTVQRDVWDRAEEFWRNVAATGVLAAPKEKPNA